MTALIDAPKQAKRGDVVTVKVVFSHPMETGYRRDISGKVIPRDIIHGFQCRYGGTVVFNAELFPAIAANPFLGFTFIAEQTGQVELLWSGDDGQIYKEQFQLTVSG